MSSTKFEAVKAADVQPGDMALHRSGDLDSRPVEDVLPGRPLLITLRIGTLVTNPVPARQYSFTREVSA